MPFTVQCSSCQSKFALPDSAYEQRIAGKVVDLTCKHCRKNIRIDGTRPRSDAPTNEVTKTARPEQPAAAEVQSRLDHGAVDESAPANLDNVYAHR